MTTSWTIASAVPACRVECRPVTEDRWLKWPALLSARDLGGPPTATGPTTRGAIVRSDDLHRLTKEVFGGWYLLEAADLDAAINIAARVPAARLGGSVEIRPLLLALH